MANLISVPVSKAGIDFDLDLDQTPDEIYKIMLVTGAKTLLGRGLTKFTVRGLVGEELEAMREKIAQKVQETIQSIYKNTIRIAGRRKAKTGIPRAVLTEAMKQAKEAIKVILRKKKIKLSTVKASELTKAATSYLEANPQLLEDAREVVRKREEAEFDISSIDLDEILSAKQAGMTQARSGGGVRRVQA